MTALLLAVLQGGSHLQQPRTARCAGRKHRDVVFPSTRLSPFLAGVVGSVAMRRKQRQQACPEAVLETG